MLWLTPVPYTHPSLADARFHDGRWAHHRVMSLFGDLGGGSQARQRGDVLFRLEPWAGETGRVLVQSGAQPVADGLRPRPLSPVLDALEPGSPVRFLLHANAVRTVNRTSAPGQPVRRHRADVSPDQLEGWISQRLGHALTLDELDTPTRHDLRLGRKVKVAVTRFSGTARVDDVDATIDLIRDGVGRAKAYGCGLLSLMPGRADRP